MRIPLNLTLCGLTLLLGCNKIQLNGDGKSATSADSQQQASADVDAEEETVDPPNNIAGSFLHCAVERESQDAANAQAEVLLGCRFDDANGKRVPVDQVGAQSLFTYRPAKIASLKVYPKALPNDNRYDAVYLFMANSKEEVRQGLAGTRIFVKMKDAVGADTAVSGLVSDVQIDVNAIPEPRQTNYDQVRDDVLTEAANNEPVPPEPDF